MAEQSARPVFRIDPVVRLTRLGFAQEPTDEHAMYAFVTHAAAWRRLFCGRLKCWQAPVLRCGFAILVRRNCLAAEIEFFREERGIAEPDATATAEFASDRRGFEL